MRGHNYSLRSTWDKYGNPEVRESAGSEEVASWRLAVSEKRSVFSPSSPENL
jgi:hypothetical protein